MLKLYAILLGFTSVNREIHSNLCVWRDKARPLNRGFTERNTSIPESPT
jgi:hypothetical protein